MINRRDFLKTSAVTSAGILSSSYVWSQPELASGKRIGMIGLDTSHCIAFTKTFNARDAGPEYGGYKVVAAFPTSGSSDLPASIDRLAGFTEQIQQYGVEIVKSIDELLEKVDVVLLETVDGRKHLEQAIPVIKSGKKMFIDKPMAASLAEALVIFGAAKYYNVPVFSSSSLRYITGMDEVKDGKIGKVYGADVYSPATIDKTHPDLFWYGIHGVEILFTAMGTGCNSVVRVSALETDVVTGKWNDDRIGTFRGIRSGKKEYGGNVFGETDVKILGPYNGYNPLLIEIVKFFNTGISPVSSEETLEIMAFMEAAQESKNKGGVPVSMEDTFQNARLKSKKYSFQ